LALPQGKKYFEQTFQNQAARTQAHKHAPLHIHTTAAAAAAAALHLAPGRCLQSAAIGKNKSAARFGSRIRSLNS